MPQRFLVSASICAVLGASVLGISIFREPISRFVWQNFHSAPIAVFLNDSDPLLLFDIGNYYFGDGAYDTKKAEQYFRLALAESPLLQGPHYQLARIYFITSDFNDALAEINKELQLHPEYGRSYYVRGLIYGYTGQLALAEADFKAFLKWKPESWAGHNDLTWIYFQEGKYTEARATARAGLLVAPDNPWLLNAVGVASLNLGDKREAKDAFTKALAALAILNPQDWGGAYPGNDPTIYGEGFSQMKASIEANLQLLN